jgi:hypothetical protein
MSLETLKKVLNKLPPTVCQVAYGIGDITSNPDLALILNHTRGKGIIPNITVNGNMSKEWAEMLSIVCGAVAVSRYSRDLCYNAVSRLCWAKRKAGATLQQVNIHMLLSDTTLSTCWQVLEDVQTDRRLNDLNAVVFLLLKPKGDRNKLKQLKSMEEYRKLVNYALDKKIRIGFDSCGASSFLEAVEGDPNFEQHKMLVEGCESTRMSIYLDVEANCYPCSFTEDMEKPISILNSENFLEEIWLSPTFENFRKRLSDGKDKHGCQTCPAFDLEMK